jgi:hypothetical protein
MKMQKIDSFNYDDLHKTYVAEYDGWLFEAKSVKAVMNQILRYINKR